MHRSTQHIALYQKPGRYAGCPVNYGIWSWQEEIVVGFMLGFTMRITAALTPSIATVLSLQISDGALLSFPIKKPLSREVTARSGTSCALLEEV